MELQTTDVRGRATQVAVGGEGPPLLYLHSAAGESYAWLDLLNGLAEHHEVHAPLQPGFFGSEGIESVHGMEDLLYHYLAFMDGRGWDQVDVMGSSLGGWIALEIAARYPERVGRLVLAAPAGITSSTNRSAQVIRAMVTLRPGRLVSPLRGTIAAHAPLPTPRSGGGRSPTPPGSRRGRSRGSSRGRACTRTSPAPVAR
jgi:pimeloyl-ACP methyl ester carboxylesterase